MSEATEKDHAEFRSGSDEPSSLHGKKDLGRAFSWQALNNAQSRYRSPIPRRLSASTSKSEFYKNLLGEQAESLQKDYEILSYRKSWRDIVGPALASHTIPDELRADTLWVISENSVYSQEIAMYAPMIQEKIAGLGYQAPRKIRTKIGKLNWS